LPTADPSDDATKEDSAAALAVAGRQLRAGGPALQILLTRLSKCECDDWVHRSPPIVVRLIHCSAVPDNVCPDDRTNNVI
jgi:hypothetical protein